MSELANLFNKYGLETGLIVFILFSASAIVAWLVRNSKAATDKAAEQLVLKDRERAEERKIYEQKLESILSRQADANLQVAKSNQNIADALLCIKMLVDTMNKKFDIHDERAIEGFKELTATSNEIKVRVETCSKRK